LQNSAVRNRDKALPTAQRYVLLSAFNNDAVLDKTTGVVWEQSPQTTTVTWNVARTTCAKKAVGGQKGWCLLSPAELRSLVGPFVDSPDPTLPPGHPFLNVVRNLEQLVGQTEWPLEGSTNPPGNDIEARVDTIVEVTSSILVQITDLSKRNKAIEKQ
jgi:hypothetical protein